MITPSFSLTATERVLPRLALDFTTASLDPRITFTRTGNTATVVNSSGYVTPINADLPRFDYDPLTLVCKGLLIEEARTNVLLNSEAINLWTAANVNVSTNNQTSPSNQLNADTLNDGSSGSSIGHYVSAAGFTPVASTTYTASCFFKNLANTQHVFISLRGAASNYGGATFDLTNLTATTSALGTGFSVSSTKIENYGNSWYRCSVTVVAGSTVSSPGAFFGFSDNSAFTTSGFPAYVAASKSMAMWGGQIETGGFATSYIPTAASQVTRTADVATMTGTNFSNWFNASEGTLLASGETIGGTPYPIYANDGTANNRIGVILRLNGISGRSADMFTAGASQLGGLSAFTFSQKNTSVLSYKTDNGTVAINGLTPNTDNTVTLPVVDRMNIGASITFTSNIWIAKIMAWNIAVTAAEVQAFSKG
jgi:hypothetical protein